MSDIVLIEALCGSPALRALVVLVVLHVLLAPVMFTTEDHWDDGEIFMHLNYCYTFLLAD